jgi:nucleoside 2-deoxyribosyltransferase
MAEVCPICRFPAEISSKEAIFPDGIIGADYPINCLRCGTFKIKDRAKVYFEQPDIIKARLRGVISAWISENNNIYIDEKTAVFLAKTPVPSFINRTMRLLSYIHNNTNYIGEKIKINTLDPKVLNYTYTENPIELKHMLEYLANKRYIDNILELGDTIRIKITPDGLLFIEEKNLSNINSSQGFVAMWFDTSMTPIYDSTIAPAISQTGYTPHRVDRREHAGKVDDEIIAQIRRSKFVVADFTDHRGGVYYEAGFAHGLGLPVIMTCREDHLEKLHFDIRQYNCILWKQDNLQEFQERLQNRIEAILGRGPLIHDTK